MDIRKVFLMMALLAGAETAEATKYYISPTGKDSYTGDSKRHPWATLGKAQQHLQAGDVVYILPGTYHVSEEEISREESSGPYKIVYDLSKSGIQGKPISYIGVVDDDGNRPVFDFSAVNPQGYRITGFLVHANFLILKNFEIIGMQVNIAGHTQSENIRVTDGNYNTFENIACHDGMGIGYYLTRQSNHNLFINCDGYNNYDPVSEEGKGGQNDAFGCHVQEDNPGNVFIGCRAWNNADDGYDLINCYSPVTFCYSIAYYNGYDADNKSRGDGNGFKAGGFGMESERTMPAGGAPMHEVYHCIAATNKANGFYSNHHLGGVYFHDNTAYRNNRYNYSMVNRRGPSLADAVDVNGYNHHLERNLSMVSDGKDNHVTSLRGDEGNNIIEGNTFSWVYKNSGGWSYTVYGNSIFESTTVSNLKESREPDGMLPETVLAVMHQKVYLGLGCVFDGYQTAIEDYRKITGAEAEGAITGIANVVRNGQTDDNYYNLAGQRTGKPHRGLYIKNGKKIIIR